jgi:murein tripeptide amidase MpaA
VDLLLDVHGDEELPYNFVAGAEGIPGWSPRLSQLQSDFQAALLRASPDFQTEVGYPVDQPGEANMGICTNQVTFVILSLQGMAGDAGDAGGGWTSAR